MTRRVGWVAWQTVFLAIVVGGVGLAVNERSWVLAVLCAYIAANVVWSLNWLPGRPGRLRRLLRHHQLGAEHPSE